MVMKLGETIPQAQLPATMKVTLGTQVLVRGKVILFQMPATRENGRLMP